MGAIHDENHLKERSVLEVPRSGLKALRHNPDAEFEDATLPFGSEKYAGPFSSAT